MFKVKCMIQAKKALLPSLVGCYRWKWVFSLWINRMVTSVCHFTLCVHQDLMVKVLCHYLMWPVGLGPPCLHPHFFCLKEYRYQSEKSLPLICLIPRHVLYGRTAEKKPLEEEKGGQQGGYNHKARADFCLFVCFFTKMNQARAVLTLITHIHLFEIAMFIILPFGRKYGGRKLYYYRL